MPKAGPRNDVRGQPSASLSYGGRARPAFGGKKLAPPAVGQTMRAIRCMAVTLAVAGGLGLSVLSGAQTPLFQTASPIPSGGPSGQLALVDTNADKHLDLVIQRPQREIVVFFGNGRGQFSPAPGGPVDIFQVEPAATAVGDVVADDQADLIVAFRDKDSEYLQVFRGDGRGRFGPGGTKRYKTNASFEYYKPAIRLADVDANGSLDIITSNGRRNTIEVLLANGRRGSAAAFTAAPIVSLTPQSSFWTFGAGDVDGDERVDLVTTFDPPGAASARVEIRKGLGNGRFQEPSAGVDVRAGARIAAVADLNADSRPDVVLSHVDTGWLSVLLNNGKGSLALASQSPRDLGWQTFGVAVTDLNRDGRADIVATTVNSRARPYESKIAVLLGDGFSRAAGSPWTVGHGAYQLAVGDVDEDGKPDIVTSSFESDSISVLLAR